MARHFSHSKIIFNCATKNELNRRIFEAMCSGSFLLTDKAEGSGLTELFHDGECLTYYNDEEIAEKAGYFLRNGNLRENIAAKGQAMVLRAHTYEHRCEDMLEVIFGQRAETPGIDELRERSKEQKLFVQPKKKEYSIEDLLAIEEKFSAERSFIIPVLDLSSQTQYNFNTLLDDLEKVEGDVIVVFNSLEMADLFKNHPRITYYAIMSHNFGVARAWNIGLDMSNAPVSFILNSDLHFEPEAIQKLEQALLTLPNAAIVGPEGGFIDFLKSEDIERFIKGMFSEPMPVDNVSGFFFAVKTNLFHDGILNFENKFTPCYYEEWDMGIQVKAKGLKGYIIPVTEYEHEFNTKSRTGSLSYMRTEETVLDISSRNQKLFWKKWLKDINEHSSTEHLRSLWFPYKMAQAEQQLANKNMQEAFNIFMQINSRDSEIASVNYYIALLLARSDHIPEARKYAEKAVAIDPDLSLAQELLANLSEMR
jgi:glycosyltransferase involved in cell wall biosynthesis